jgi:hypothetical protein
MVLGLVGLDGAVENNRSVKQMMQETRPGG